MMKLGWRRWWPALTIALLILTATMPAAMGSTPSPQTPQTSDEDVVVTDAGPVRGTVAADYRLFQGIPYAAPPVGELRWRSPRPVSPWTEPRDATAPGSRCPQVGDEYNGPRSEDEDCLFLDVTTPRPADPASPKPVMVWIHGGGLVGGAGSDHDGRRLAVAGDVVVVTVNYRLGILGFFAHPELTNGGYGLEDQQAALRWVRDNITAFGGDPGNVTLFGESGGAVSVCAHLTSPTAAELFHRAIIQSGGCIGDAPANTFFPGVPEFATWPTIEEIEGIGAAVAAGAGCGDPATAVACLRALPAADLLVGTAIFTRPGSGTPLLPESPELALNEGRFHQVPVLAGHTRDEGTMWAAFHPQPITAAYYQEQLAIAFGDDAGRIAAEYPVADYDTPGLAWAAVVTDRVWACPTLAGHRLFAADVPTFVYRFDDRNAPRIFPETPEIPLGAYHASELLYLFATVGLGAPEPLTAGQRELSTQMIQYWANFARSGDPNGPGLPAWEPFTNDDPVPIVQGLAPGAAGIDAIDAIAEHRCDFWAELATGD